MNPKTLAAAIRKQVPATATLKEHAIAVRDLRASTDKIARHIVESFGLTVGAAALEILKEEGVGIRFGKMSKVAVEELFSEVRDRDPEVHAAFVQALFDAAAKP